MSRTEHDEIEGTASLSYVCDDCGRVHNRNNPPCNDCGSMSFSVREATDDPTRIDEAESWELVRDAEAGLTGVTVFVYGVGVLTVVLGAFELATATPVAGLSLLAAGVLAVPASRWRIERLLSVHLSPRMVLATYLGLSVGGYAIELFL